MEMSSKVSKEERTVLIFYNQKTSEFFLRNFEPKKKVEVNKIRCEVKNSMSLLCNPKKLAFAGDCLIINKIIRLYYLVTVEAALDAFSIKEPYTYIGSIKSGFLLPERDRKLQQLSRAFSASVQLVKLSQV